MEKKNILNLIEGFKKQFNYEPKSYITAGGRLEIIGNHTDHNHGLCIVGNCSLRIVSTVAKNTNGLVNILSKGHDFFSLDSNDLEIKESEYTTTKGMVRGILRGVKDRGYSVGGFDAYIESDIPEGSGVSSSAAFEVLIGEILNYLYNDTKIESIDIAKIGQFSEKTYFHKPCGLLDQIGAAFKDLNYLDFKNIDEPIVEGLDFNLPVSLYLINSIGDHSNLTHLYAAIPNGMRKVANLLGADFLRETKEDDFLELVANNKIDDEEAIKKARHFYLENKNVLLAKKAIEENDIDTFFEAIRRTQNSSHINLENTYVKGEYEDSPQDIIDKCNKLPDFANWGAIRIHGGGFKGSVLAFIKNEWADDFEAFLNLNYKGRYNKVGISKEGVTREEII